MYFYHLSEWMLFFYIYCFLGWCFETTYVSVFCEHKFVNRGFLFGPYLPIYGSGALVILLSTIPVRGNLWLVGLVGMSAATVLEYVTGVVMESIFKVRYWDYTNEKFNFQGQICLKSSLTWGVMSVLLVRFLHVPFETFVLGLDMTLKRILVLGITVFFVIDLIHAVSTAIDLRQLLVKIDAVRDEFKRIQQRVETLEKQLAANGRAQVSEELAHLKERRDAIWNQIKGHLSRDKWELLSRNPQALSRYYKEPLEKVREWFKRQYKDR